MHQLIICCSPTAVVIVVIATVIIAATAVVIVFLAQVIPQLCSFDELLNLLFAISVADSIPATSAAAMPCGAADSCFTSAAAHRSPRTYRSCGRQASADGNTTAAGTPSADCAFVQSTSASSNTLTASILFRAKPKRGSWVWVENACNECGNQCEERYSTADCPLTSNWSPPIVCCSQFCIKRFVLHSWESIHGHSTTSRITRRDMRPATQVVS